VPEVVPMKQLTLIRHAKAVDGEDFDDDHERPLRGRGHRASSELGRDLASNPPCLILCSTALRTRQTVADVIAGWPAVPPIRYERELYLSTATTLLRRLRRVEPQYGSVWLVGHNPGMHELARLLARNAAGAESFPALREQFPTAARAVFALDADDWSQLGAAPQALQEFALPAGE
jgi:phosphohistidine phosphatase